MTSISSGVEILLGLSPPMCPNGRVSSPGVLRRVHDRKQPRISKSILRDYNENSSIEI